MSECCDLRTDDITAWNDYPIIEMCTVCIEALGGDEQALYQLECEPYWA